MENLIVIFIMALLYLPPLYLGWRFFWKRGLKGWAWGTWLACLFGPIAYIVFAIGYFSNRGIEKDCPQCKTLTRSGKRQSVTAQGEYLKEPIIAWLAMIGGGILAAAAVITVVIFLIDGEGLGGYCSTFGLAAMLGFSGVTWGYTQLNKARGIQGNVTTTYQFKCPACGHSWEHKIEPTDLPKLK